MTEQEAIEFALKEMATGGYGIDRTLWNEQFKQAADTLRALADQHAALRAVVAEMVDKCVVRVYDYDAIVQGDAIPNESGWYCYVCRQNSLGETIRHTTDCPIERARRLLADAQEEK